MKKSIIHTIVYGVGNLSVRLIALLLIPILTNDAYLSVSDFGVYSLIEVGVQLLTSALGAGLYMGLSRFYWDEKYQSSKEGLFGFTMVMVAILSIGFSALSFVWSEKASEVFFQSAKYADIIKMAVISAGLQALLLATQTLQKLQSKSAMYSLLNIARTLIFLCLAYLLLVRYKSGLTGVYQAQVLSLLGCLLVALPYIVKNFSFHIKLFDVKDLVRYSTPLLISSLLIISVGLFDKFILNQEGGLDNVAVYALGYKLANSIKIFVITSVQLTLSPILMKRMKSSDNKLFYQKVLRYFSMGLMAVLLTSALFGKEILHLITVNEAYMESYPIFVILLIGFYFEMIRDQVALGLVIEKKSVVTGLISLLISILSVFVYKLLAPYAHGVGVAIGFVLVKFVSMLLIYIFAQKVYRIPYQMGKSFKVLLLGIVLYSVVLMLNTLNGSMLYLIKFVLLALFPMGLLGLKVISRNEILVWKEKIKQIKA